MNKEWPLPAEGAVWVAVTGELFALVDTEYAPEVLVYDWWKAKRRRVTYAQTSSGGEKIFLHRFLWKLWAMPETPEIDHIDGNGLNNRRHNLRAAQQWENSGNTPKHIDNHCGFKGVHKDHTGRWRADIRFLGKNRNLGRFDSPEAAARVYDAWAKETFGEFAKTNFG